MENKENLETQPGISSNPEEGQTNSPAVDHADDTSHSEKSTDDSKSAGTEKPPTTKQKNKKQDTAAEKDGADGQKDTLAAEKKESQPGEKDSSQQKEESASENKMDVTPEEHQSESSEGSNSSTGDAFVAESEGNISNNKMKDEPSFEIHEDDSETEQKEENNTEDIEAVESKNNEVKSADSDNQQNEDLIEEEGNEDDEDDDEDHDEESSNSIDYHKLSRQELVDLLEQTLKEGEIVAIKKKVALIKVAFLKKNKEEQEKRFESYIKDGGEEDDFTPEQDDTEVRFNAAFSIYKQKKAKWIEEQEQIKQKNLETKKLILEELKALIESEESLKTTYDEFRNLQDKWKEAGMVPKSEVNNLWQNYHFYVEKFFDKVKINKELRDLDLKKNLELKVELCEAAEELLLESSIMKSFKKLQQLHKQWKETGPVPVDKKDELWERFKTATDKINQRRRDHYNKLKEDQKNNLLAKTALCEKAEEILQIDNETIKDWQKNTDAISELLKVWKTIGPAPRKENDEIWERFKTSLDTFFAGKKEFFQTIKEEQQNNYNQKLDLCIQAEALKSSTDWRKTTQDLINLQQEWKKIGPVPKRHSDKIWKRFRAACDEFFNNKSEYFSNIKEHEGENLKKKEELIKQVEEYAFDDDKNKNLEVLKEFQRKWMEIGHVPYKDKDKIQNSFRNAINNQLDKLNINKAEIRTVNYKNRIEGMKERPNANRIINNERSFLQNKRRQLEEDVKLWENNMGFLASSKKADLLKKEFEKKIEKVKSEIEVLTEKIKFLERETR